MWSSALVSSAAAGLRLVRALRGTMLQEQASSQPERGRGREIRPSPLRLLLTSGNRVRCLSPFPPSRRSSLLGCSEQCRALRSLALLLPLRRLPSLPMERLYLCASDGPAPFFVETRRGREGRYAGGLCTSSKHTPWAQQAGECVRPDVSSARLLCCAVPTHAWLIVPRRSHLSRPASPPLPSMHLIRTCPSPLFKKITGTRAWLICRVWIYMDKRCASGRRSSRRAVSLPVASLPHPFPAPSICGGSPTKWQCQPLRAPTAALSARRQSLRRT